MCAEAIEAVRKAIHEASVHRGHELHEPELSIYAGVAANALQDVGGGAEPLETFDTDRLVLQFNRDGAYDRDHYEDNMVKRIERAIEDAMDDDDEHLEDTVKRLGLEVVLRSALSQPEDGSKEGQVDAAAFLRCLARSQPQAGERGVVVSLSREEAEAVVWELDTKATRDSEAASTAEDKLRAALKPGSNAKEREEGEEK